MAVSQTTNGYLWLGTYDRGLIRFDGVRFVKWDFGKTETSANRSIASLRAAHDGGLWIGTREGLSKLKNKQLTTYTTKEGLSGGSVLAIIEEKDGAVWAGTFGYQTGGLSRLENGRIKSFGTTDGLPGVGLNVIDKDHEGTLWLGGLGGLTRWDAHGATVVFRSNTEQIASIAETPDHTLWLVSSRGLLRYSSQQFERYSFPIAAKPYRLLVDRDGGLWIATLGQGLFHLYEQRLDRFTRLDGLSSDTVWDLFEDREGNVWAGTTDGLDRFREYKVPTPLQSGKPYRDGGIFSLVATHGRGVCVGGRRTGLDCFENDRLKTYGIHEGLPDATVFSLVETSNGGLLAGTAKGLFLANAGSFKQIADSLNEVFGLARGPGGQSWIADGQKGLFQLGNMGSPVPIAPERFSGKPLFALLADRTEALWIGASEGGAARYASGVLQTFASEQGLGSGYVADFFEDHSGTIWAATEGGLSRYNDNGRFVTLTTDSGLPCDGIHGILEDDYGFLWLRTACGLVRAKLTDLMTASDGRGVQIPYELFGPSDGFRAAARPEGTARRAAKAADGKLWFATSDGIAIVDPKRIPRNNVPPPVHIEEVSIDGKQTDLSRMLILPPTVMRIQFSYTAPSFTDPDRVRFKYQLEGFDPTWIDAGTTRQAVYTNLRPGTYCFRVIACNNDGVWNQTGASFNFEVDSAFLQTRLFGWLSGAMALAFFWLVHYLRFHGSPRHPLANLVRAYPTGLPGFGLLVLRLAVGVYLIVDTIWFNPANNSGSLVAQAARLFELGCGALLVIGLWTPVVGALLSFAIVMQLVQRAASDAGYASLGGDWLNTLLYFITVAAVTLLGPGAYSLDAQQFTRKQFIVIPSSSAD